MIASNTSTHGFHCEGDRVMRFVLGFLFFFSLTLSPWYDTWLSAILVGGIAAGVPATLIHFKPGLLITRISVSVSFMVFAGLQIHQGHGLIETHFGVFVLLAFLLYYRDWRVVVSGLVTIAVHHVSFNYLQAWDTGVWVFRNGPSLTMVLTHATYATFECIILIFMAIQSEQEALRNEELKEISEHFVVVDDMINLRYRKKNAQSEFAHDFNNFMGAVNEAISRSQTTARSLVASSEELKKVSLNTKKGTKLQQNSTAKVVSAINYMVKSVQAVEESTDDTVKATKETVAIIENGTTVVDETINILKTLANKADQTLEIITRLESHTDNIGTVLEAIKGIANQTNLLALNATIEATRAGEHGKGFSIVADEVKTLANRTQQATKEIHGTIEILQTETDNAVNAMKEGRIHAYSGVEQASKTNDAFALIADSVGVISNMKSRIASSIEQQSTVVIEIKNNVTEINKVSEETAEGASSLTKHCDELSERSNELANLVDKFAV